MAKELKDMEPAAHVAEIVHHGERLIIPEGMAVKEAIVLLKMREAYLKEEVQLMESFDAFPWDGANALNCVLERRFGWAHGVPSPGFFGDRPPSMVSIDVSAKKTKQVPWGNFTIPGVEGVLGTSVQRKEGRVCFMLTASVLRKDEATVVSIFADVRKELQTNSIYKGKAIKMRFLDEDGDTLPMPEPKFIDTDSIDPSQLICNPETMSAIETNLFTPVSRARDCLANGISLKRGILLGGTYGVGKTLAATVASKLAVEAGITYLYVPRANELPMAIEFAKQYQSPACVIFCEDVDRTVSGERDVEMDDLLNIIDGIDTKQSNLIVVLTTNALENINPAMLRPGRLDAVINFTLPNAGTVERLLRHYGGNQIAFDTELVEAAELLEGTIPAVVAEVIKRAQLAQLRLQAPGEPLRELSSAAVTEAARSTRMQVELLRKATSGKVDKTMGGKLGELFDDLRSMTPMGQAQ